LEDQVHCLTLDGEEPAENQLKKVRLEILVYTPLD
jgi:hypothetical protein